MILSPRVFLSLLLSPSFSIDLYRVSKQSLYQVTINLSPEISTYSLNLSPQQRVAHRQLPHREPIGNSFLHSVFPIILPFCKNIQSLCISFFFHVPQEHSISTHQRVSHSSARKISCNTTKKIPTSFVVYRLLDFLTSCNTTSRLPAIDSLTS